MFNVQTACCGQVLSILADSGADWKSRHILNALGRNNEHIAILTLALDRYQSYTREKLLAAMQSFPGGGQG